MKPTRVLQVVLSLNPGGTERLVVELATRLHSHIPMAVCCLDAAGAWADSVRAHGIDVTTVQRPPGFHPWLGRSICAVADRHHATVVHAHHYSPFVYSAMARLWRPSRRLVFTEHGRLSDAPPSTRRRMANRVLSLAPDRVFAVSRELGDHIAAEGFGRRVEVIHNGIEAGSLPTKEERLRVRQQLGVSEDAIVIGTVARLDPVKNLLTLIKAVRRLSSPSVKLVIIGDGPERVRLTTAAAEAGLSHHATFLGHRDDARAWLPGFDVYVNCSTSEGVSLTILEAMAAGVCVVATAVGGTREVVSDTCGWLIPARDPNALADAIDTLARDRARRLALGQGGRARVEAHFTLDRMVEDYRRVYAAGASAPEVGEPLEY